MNMAATGMLSQQANPNMIGQQNMFITQSNILKMQQNGMACMLFWFLSACHCIFGFYQILLLLLGFSCQKLIFYANSILSCYYICLNLGQFYLFTFFF